MEVASARELELVIGGGIAGGPEPIDLGFGGHWWCSRSWWRRRY